MLAVYNRRFSNTIKRCNSLTDQINIKLEYKNINNFRINGIEKLNKYITIQNKNYEIYNIHDNKLIDYFIQNKNNQLLPSDYILNIKTILTLLNYHECNVYIYNTEYKNISIQSIMRFEKPAESKLVEGKDKPKKAEKRRRDQLSEFDSLVKEKFDYTITDEWIAASKTRNSALKDRCLDYYDEYGITKYSDDPIKQYKKSRRSFSESTEQKFKDGIDFENKVIEYIKSKYPTKFIEICKAYEARDKDMCIKTFRAMYDGIPLIYQAVLQNPTTKTLGSVDLLVRSDMINELTNTKYDIDDIKQTIFPHNKYYYAVDIKSACLQFNVDNKTVRNGGSVAPFKYQLSIYNEALKHMQSVDTTRSFILGRGWKMERQINKQRVVERSNDYMDRLGMIDFKEFDKSIIRDANNSILWLQDLKKSTDWTHKPPSNDNILPNMCNTNDDGYRHIKAECAEEIKDITLISYLTPEHRKVAKLHGITRFDDPRLNSSLLQMNGINGKLVDAILNTNRDKSDQIVFFKTLDPTPDNILSSNRLEYYIDFETMIHQTDGSSREYVYMIGLGYVFNKKWTYKCMTLEKLDDKSQIKMYNELRAYIEETNNKYITKDKPYEPLYYHWSSVEPNFLNKMISKLDLPLNNIRWFDLYKYFKENVITVKGAYGFSLKSVGKGMYKNKLIDTYWDSNILMDNKINTIAYDKYVKLLNKETEFNDLITYNEVDCKIMYDILEVIRKLKI